MSKDIFEIINPTNTLGVCRPLAHILGACETIVYNALLSKYRYYQKKPETAKVSDLAVGDIIMYDGARREVEKISDKSISFSSEANAEILVATEAIKQILDITVKAFENNDAELALDVEPLEQVIDTLLSEIKNRHISRLTGGNCTIELGFVLSDLLTNYERVSDHCSNIAVSLIQISHSVFDTHEYLNDYKTSGGERFTTAFENYKKQYILP